MCSAQQFQKPFQFIAHISVLSPSGILLTAFFKFRSMFQMSNLCLQEQQRTPELIPKFLDFLDVFLVNLVRDIGTVGDLVDIVRNVIGDTVYLFQLIFVDLNDVSLKDHSSHKFAEIAHTAALNLHLDGSHFFGADTDFQVHCSLLFIFHFLFFLSSVFQVRGRSGRYILVCK